MSKGVCPYFFPKSFFLKVFDFKVFYIFKGFEFIFVYGVRN